MNKFLTVLAASLLPLAASAQQTFLTDASGAPLPLRVDQNGVPILLNTDPAGAGYFDVVFLTTSKDVYLRLPETLDTGWYAFDVVDNTQFHPLSLLAPEDRVFLATKNTGGPGFSISRPSQSTTLPPIVTVPNTDISLMPVFPYSSPLLMPSVDLECTGKVFLYSLGNGPVPGVPQYLNYSRFKVVGQDRVEGTVFEDINANSAWDPSLEPGVAGCLVRLFDENDVQIGERTTDGNGRYEFNGIGFGSYKVVLLIDPIQNQATTPTDVTISASGCCAVTVNFGKRTNQQTCVGYTPGFWSNNNGIAIINAGPFWQQLRDLNLRDQAGNHFDPSGSVNEWRNYLRGRDATNMAYQLSAHLAAMQLNVLRGSVGLGCWVATPGIPGTPQMTIGALMQAANTSLGLHGHTTPGNPNRAAQEALKNALDAANNNQNWL